MLSHSHFNFYFHFHFSSTTQALVYQKGLSSGVVCYDRQRHEVYFAQHADVALLQTQIQGFRFILPHERSMQLFIFLSSALTYTETLHEVCFVTLLSSWS